MFSLWSVVTYVHIHFFQTNNSIVRLLPLNQLVIVCSMNFNITKNYLIVKKNCQRENKIKALDCITFLVTTEITYTFFQ